MDPETFETLVRRHAGAVSAYARAVCGDPWAAEEAVQETFLRAWKYRPSFRGTGSFEGWLLRICRNCIIDHANRDDRHHLPLGDHDCEAPPDLSPELLVLMGTLPVAHREVLALCALLGYDYSSAAAILDVPVGTVRSGSARAREAITTHLNTDEKLA